MKKWIFSVFLAGLLLFALVPTTTEVEAARDITVFVDGQRVFFPDQRPVIIGD